MKLLALEQRDLRGERPSECRQPTTRFTTCPGTQNGRRSINSRAAPALPPSRVDDEASIELTQRTSALEDCLQLLSTYGLRAGEITHLRLNDIDWRAETLRIRHSKTGAHSLLPLMPPVGEALVNYLRDGRPQTDAREIFIRSRAPYLPLSWIYSGVRRRMEAAGVKMARQSGATAQAPARAVRGKRGVGSDRRSSLPCQVSGRQECQKPQRLFRPVRSDLALEVGHFGKAMSATAIGHRPAPYEGGMAMLAVMAMLAGVVRCKIEARRHC